MIRRIPLSMPVIWERRGSSFFEAYDQAKRMGLDKKNWLDAAFEICEFAMSRQRLDGGIGMSWNRDGSPMS